MSLTFTEYQDRAATTAVYPRQYVLTTGKVVDPTTRSCIYPVFGLCGEIGEFASVFTDKLGLVGDVYSEAGDVLWYVAAICSDLKISLRDVVGCETFAQCSHYSLANTSSIEELLIELFKAAGIVSEAAKKTIRDNDGVVMDARLKTIQNALFRVLMALGAICYKQDIRLEAVASQNLAKLASRANKGTIQGSGDNR